MNADERRSAFIRVHAFSKPAYFSTNFFCPNPGKLTVSFVDSPAPSRRRTNPRPYFECLTYDPGVNSAEVEAVVGCGFFGRLPDVWPIWRLRCLKKSAIESALS